MMVGREGLNMSNEITEEQAIAIYDSKIWKAWSDYEKVKFQLFTPRLCMPITEIAKSLSNELRRSVFDYEFADPEKLRKEFLGEKEAPTFEEICQLIPKEIRNNIKL